MKQGDEVKLGFTTIMHDPRLRFGLNNNEYCIADAIYHLSHNPDSIAPGWCYASREKIGMFFGLSRPSVIRALKKLIDKGLVEIHEQTKYLRASKIWYENFVLYELESKKSRV